MFQVFRNNDLRFAVLGANTLSGFFLSTGATCHPAGDESHELRNTRLTPAIEMRADEAGLDDLRAATLTPGDIEARIWIEPMMILNAAEGYMIRRTGSSWTGKHLLRRENNPNAVRDGGAVVISPKLSGLARSADVEPLNGWDFLWNNLTSSGLLALPDEEELDLRAHQGMAGEIFMYVVEVKTGGEYRTYHYTAPERYDRPETKAMARIVRLLQDEFSKDQQE